ncbi:glycosyltransferase, partial [bacterium]|nr:glycosyltransferase [bacterium]
MPSFCKPSISVIIPVYNGGSNFKKCLQSLAAALTSYEETIVVADGDTDGSWRVAKEFGAQVLRIPTPQGPARARNLGAATAKGDILFFLDADVTVPPDAVSSIVAAFHDDPTLAAVFGSYDDEPAETNFLSQYKNLFHHYVHQTAKDKASTFWTGCGAIRRQVFLRMGGFDEGYRHPCIEDIELGYRLRRAGYGIHLLKQVKVKHLKRWSAMSLLKADFFYRALPWTDLILNEGRFIDDLNLKASNRISVMSIYLLILALLGGVWTPWSLIPTVFLMMVLFGFNWDLYRFFRNKRSLGFAVKTIPWHWFYFF